jgi:hypothetical protein
MLAFNVVVLLASTTRTGIYTAPCGGGYTPISGRHPRPRGSPLDPVTVTPPCHRSAPSHFQIPVLKPCSRIETLTLTKNKNKPSV